MYPNTYLSLFPAFPRDNRVFVAMSFAPEFDSRWENVIAPAIKRVSVGDNPLKPHRVDLRKVSDSILTEILDGIARCRFFIADISTIGYVDGRAMRNANVMYEVGIAHAARLPEEVLLLRSDEDELDFDVHDIRVLRYDPGRDSDAARRLLADTVSDCLREVDLRKNLAVRRVTDTLDAACLELVMFASRDDGKVIPTAHRLKDLGLTLAISQLLASGILASHLRGINAGELNSELKTEDILHYQLTEFGRAVAALITSRAATPGLIQSMVDESLAPILAKSAEQRSPNEKALLCVPSTDISSRLLKDMGRDSP